MSNTEFELISPDRLNETSQTDWRLYSLCQIEKKKKSCRIHFLKMVTLFSAFFYKIS